MSTIIGRGADNDRICERRTASPSKNSTYFSDPRFSQFCLLHMRFPAALTHIILFFQTTVHRILRKPRHNSRPPPKQLTLELQTPQLMDCPEIPQSPLHGSQASEGSSSIASQAPCRRIYDSSNTTSQPPQLDRRPVSQSVPSGRSELLPELSPWLAHRLDPHELSASPLQASSSIPPSIYAPGRPQQDSTSPESQSLQQYIPSQTPNGYSLSSSYFEAVAPSVHSHQRYGGGGTTTSFRGSEGSRSGRWPTYNVDDTPVTSMDAYGRRIVQGSSIELYNPGAEQSNEQGPNVLSGMDSWGSPRVPGGANVSGSYHRSDGMRYSFNHRSATDRRQGLTVNPSLVWNPVPVENNPARRNQGIHSQEIGWPVDQSARGIDQSLQSRDFPEVLGSFVEDADNTNTDVEYSQNEGYPHNLGFYGNYCSSNLSALAPSYAPESRNILSSIAPNLTPHIDHGAHSQLAPESSERCQICDMPFSNSENRRRHMREQHREKVQYICQLRKDGSVCSANVKVARNRRRHVEVVHPQESTELPPTSTNRRSNDKTDEILNGWFDKVQQ